MAVMVETRDLTYTYPAPEGETNPPALRDVSVQIEKGSFTVVLGHNGSGKSTFAKHLNAVLLPCGGAVYVDGMDTRDEKLLLEIRRRTGMVFQNPDNQIVANVVEEDVAFGPENLGVPTAEIRRRVDDALSTGSTPRTCSPAGRSSASPLRVFWPWSRSASCWTRPRLCWTRRDGVRSSTPCCG